jgi:hypothetical protein
MHGPAYASSLGLHLPAPRGLNNHFDDLTILRLHEYVEYVGAEEYTEDDGLWRWSAPRACQSYSVLNTFLQQLL